MRVIQERGGYAIVADCYPDGGVQYGYERYYGGKPLRCIATEAEARRLMLDLFDHDHDCKDFDYSAEGDPPEYVGGCVECARQRREERKQQGNEK